jgi:hypothetical protein
VPEPTYLSREAARFLAKAGAPVVADYLPYNQPPSRDNWVFVGNATLALQAKLPHADRYRFYLLPQPRSRVVPV